MKGINFVILEASDRILGRVAKDGSFADFPIELGAEFCHGSNNPFMDIIKEHLGSEFRQVVHLDNELVYIPFMKRALSAQEILESPFANQLEEIELSQIDQQFLNTKRKDDCTFNDYFRENYSDNLFHQMMKGFCSMELGADPQEIGIKGMQRDYSNSPDIKRKDHILVKGSNFDLLSLHFKQILPNVILNSAVSRVEYSHEEIQVTLTNGKIFKSRFIIVTASLGVLKDNIIEFVPKLPDTHLSAINRLGFGGALKVFLKFRIALWKEGTGMIFPNELGCCSMYLVSSVQGRTEQDHVIYGFITGNRNTLYSENKGKLVQEVVAQLSRVLNIPQSKINEEILAVLIQDWTSSPYIRGGYSFYKFGNAERDYRADLGEPIMGKLIIGGEATSVKYPQTVSGGIDSGYRCADFIIDRINDKDF